MPIPEDVQGDGPAGRDVKYSVTVLEMKVASFLPQQVEMHETRQVEGPSDEQEETSEAA